MRGAGRCTSHPRARDGTHNYLGKFLETVVVVFGTVLFVFVNKFITVAKLSLLAVLSLKIPLVLACFGVLPVSSCPVRVFRRAGTSTGVVFVADSLVFLPLALCVNVQFLHQLLKGKGPSKT